MLSVHCGMQLGKAFLGMGGDLSTTNTNLLRQHKDAILHACTCSLYDAAAAEDISSLAHMPAHFGGECLSFRKQNRKHTAVTTGTGSSFVFYSKSSPAYSSFP